MASNRCFMRLEKIKTMGALKARYNHDYRVANVENADPDRKDLNEVLFAIPDDDGTELSYERAWKKRVTEAQTKGGWTNIRKNGVLAYDIVLSYSADFDIDLEEWKKRNVKWLQTTFNRSLHGGQNLLSCVMHNDEANVHCHAIVIPITPDERLCASYYTDGAGKMMKLQDSYAKAMAPLGLKRGVKGSTATHKDIKHLYAQLKQDISIPEPEEGELARDYVKRAGKDLRDKKGSSMRKIHEEERERRAKMDEQLALEREESLKENQAIILAALRKQDDILAVAAEAEKKRKADEKRHQELEEQYKGLLAYINALTEKYDRQRNTHEKMAEMEKFMKGMEWQEKNDPEAYKLTKNAYQTCLDCADHFLERSEFELQDPEMFG